MVDIDVKRGARRAHLELHAVQLGLVDGARTRVAPIRLLLELLEGEHETLPLLGQVEVGAEVVEALATAPRLGRGGGIGHLEANLAPRARSLARPEGDAVVAGGIVGGLGIDEVETDPAVANPG